MKERLATLRANLDGEIEGLKPQHVIVNDRHGTMLWDEVAPPGFAWAHNVSFSSVVEPMTSEEMRSRFGHGPVLLFVDNVSAIRETYTLAWRLKSEGVAVHVFDEPADKPAAAIRTPDQALGSYGWLTRDLEPAMAAPRDVDHLILEAGLTLSPASIQAKMATWGSAFTVSDLRFDLLSLTLDRPQFFDAGAAEAPWRSRGFGIDWIGPCKVRLYLDTVETRGHCAFVVYPEIEAPLQAWRTLWVSGPGHHEDAHRALARAYISICMELSVQLLADLMSSGVAGQLGLKLAFDGRAGGKLQALCGPARGRQLERAVRAALSSQRKPPHASGCTPPPLLLRKDESYGKGPGPECLQALLGVLRPAVEGSADRSLEALSYGDVLMSADSLSEPAVSQALDLGLDTGVIRPEFIRESHTADRVWIVRMKRGYCRQAQNPATEKMGETLRGQGGGRSTRSELT